MTKLYECRARKEESIKNDTFWALYLEGIGFLCGTYVTRRDCIADFIKGKNHDWKQARKLGFSARKIRLVEVK